MKLPKIFFIAIPLMTAMCSFVFAEASHRQSCTAEKEIKKSVTAVDRAGKEAGRSIGQKLIKIGKQAGKVLKDIDRTLRETAQKDLR